MNPQSQPIEPASLPRPIDPTTMQQQGLPAATSAQPHIPQAPAPQNLVAEGKKSTHSPDIAEDVDLIEKEWVEKAKHIVASTKENPREQNVEIAKLKADYMKQRYNKEVEVDTE